MFTKWKLIRCYYLDNIYIVYRNRIFILMKFVFFNFSVIKFKFFFNPFSYMVFIIFFWSKFIASKRPNLLHQKNVLRNFFLFYNYFFYTQQVFIFHLLRDFCRVHHDHIIAFFSFSSLERFWYLSQAFFCSLSLFS